MSFKIGIVGLPNVGKSTLFEAITKNQVEAENYPFCTIDPNIGTVKVPDDRVQKLAEITGSDRAVNTTVEFVDIAGLVKGAHEGKGLGNKFLSNIRKVDAVVQVLRDFEDPDIAHVEGSIDLERDKDIIDIELIMADLQMTEKALKRIQDERETKENEFKLKTLKKIKKFLEGEKLISQLELTEKEREAIKELDFLTDKPIIYLKNVDKPSENSDFLEINAKIESELADFSPEEARDYLRSYNIKERGLEKLIRESYQALDLVSFFTSEEKESRAWTVKRGTKAPVAGGRIHSDFQDNFIRAEVVSYEDFVRYGGWVGAKKEGAVRDKGRDYQVKDGDVIFFKTEQS